MSTDTDNLTTDDQAFLEYIEGEGNESEVQDETDPADQLHPALEQRLAELERRWEKKFNEQQDTIEAQAETIQFLVSKVNEHDDLAEGRDPERHLTTLEKYARKPREERKRDLNAKEYRATVIFENWSEWAEPTNAGPSITTQQRRGQSGKLALKVDLENALDDDVTLQSNLVHRAMRELARLSADHPDEIAETTTEHGLTRITGGAFEYQERKTPDNKNTYKVVTLVDPDRVSLP